MSSSQENDDMSRSKNDLRIKSNEIEEETTKNYSSYLQGLQWMTDRIKNHHQTFFSSTSSSSSSSHHVAVPMNADGPTSFTQHLNNVLSSSGVFDPTASHQMTTNSGDYLHNRLFTDDPPPNPLQGFYDETSSSPEDDTQLPYFHRVAETSLTTGKLPSDTLSISMYDQKNDTQTKPPFSYITLIVSAMKSKASKKITLNEIYTWITSNFAYYRKNTRRWQNSIRHALSFNDCFIKVPRPSGEAGKGSYWTIHPNANDMFESGSSMRRNRKFIDENRSRTGLVIKNVEQCVKTSFTNGYNQHDVNFPGGGYQQQHPQSPTEQFQVKSEGQMNSDGSQSLDRFFPNTSSKLERNTWYSHHDAVDADCDEEQPNQMLYRNLSLLVNEESTKNSTESYPTINSIIGASSLTSDNVSLPCESQTSSCLPASQGLTWPTNHQAVFPLPPSTPTSMFDQSGDSFLQTGYSNNNKTTNISRPNEDTMYSVQRSQISSTSPIDDSYNETNNQSSQVYGNYRELLYQKTHIGCTLEDTEFVKENEVSSMSLTTTANMAPPFVCSSYNFYDFLMNEG